MINSDSFIPKPTGEKVLSGEWASLFELIVSSNPQISLFDGENDINGIIVRSENDDSNRPKFLIVEAMLPDLSEELLEKQQILNLRMQYYLNELHHEISAHGKMVEALDEDAVKIELFAPLRRVSSLYLACPSEDEPAIIEIPIAGIPPEVNVVGISTRKVIARADSIEELLKSPIDVEGIKLDLNELGIVTLDGKIKSDGKDLLEIQIEVLDDSDRAKIQQFQDDRFRTSVEKIQREHQEQVRQQALEKTDEKPEPVKKDKEAKKTEEIIDQKIVETEITEPEKPVESKPKAIKKKRKKYKDRTIRDGDSPGIALVIMRDFESRKKWLKFLTHQGWKKRSFSGLDETLPSDFPGVNLLWMDAKQKSGDSIDFIEKWIDEDLIEPLPFILMGDKLEEARPEDWDKYGKGLFVRPNAPKEWLNIKMSEWLDYEFPSFNDEDTEEDFEEEAEELPITGEKERIEALEEPEVEEEETPEPEEEKEKKTIDLRTVFILSDTEEGTQDLNDLLTNNDFKSIIMRDLEHAKKYCDIWVPEMILINVNDSVNAVLPMLREMRSDYSFSSIPRVLLAPTISQQQLNLAMELGVTTHITKPYNEDSMIIRLDALMG